MKPLAALAVPGMYLVYKYNQFKRQQQETNKRKITERELAHLNHKIDKLLTKLDEHEPELATSQEDECVICCSARATMQTYPCGHRVVCRRCFVKTIQIAVSQRMLPLRCVICRTKILRLKQTTSSYYFRGALNTLNSASPNSPISPTYIFNQHQHLANLAGFRNSSIQSDKPFSLNDSKYSLDTSNERLAMGKNQRSPSTHSRPNHLELRDQYGYALLQQKIKACGESVPGAPKVRVSSPYTEERPFNPEHDGMTLYASRQRKNYINYRKKYKSVASKAANLPPIAELESPSHNYRSIDYDGDEIFDLDDVGKTVTDDEDDDDDLLLTSASTPLVSNYKKSFFPSFLRPKSAKKFFRSQK